ncbi:hypothetical protein M9H77_04805 [Catharanthus roseus]|uniref:Uncharacterized protein n=1 Tax=Catharanthus roseus TaxID=4058 RepID=A0ACC0CFG4_CATRO|nr:hypothetical protein M9H77_04805 [Catharanthus roseus]
MPGKKARSKRFAPHWLKEDDCLEVFDKLWIPKPSPSADSVKTNFSSILDHLLDWSKRKYRNLPLKIKRIKKKLDNIQSQNSWSAMEEVQLEMELDTLLTQEEEYWKTISRVGWLTEGDRNTTYFYRKVSQ